MQPPKAIIIPRTNSHDGRAKLLKLRRWPTLCIAAWNIANEIRWVTELNHVGSGFLCLFQDVIESLFLLNWNDFPKSTTKWTVLKPIVCPNMNLTLTYFNLFTKKNEQSTCKENWNLARGSGPNPSSCRRTWGIGAKRWQLKKMRSLEVTGFIPLALPGFWLLDIQFLSKEAFNTCSSKGRIPKRYFCKVYEWSMFYTVYKIMECMSSQDHKYRSCWGRGM